MFIYKQKTYIEKRHEGIWQNLFQFPLIEGFLPLEQVKINAMELLKNKESITLNKTFECQHLLSHRKIKANFYTISLQSKPLFSKSDIFEIEIDELATKYPIPVLIQKFIKQQNK